MPKDEVLNYRAKPGHGIVYGWYYLGILVYVGKTINTIMDRAGEVGSKYVTRKSSSKFGKFLLLHGWENFEVKILAEPEIENITIVEDEYISNFNLIENGCNLYHACVDEPDDEAYTEIRNGYKANVYRTDKLRGDVRIGAIHDRLLKLNLIDQEIFKDFYLAPSRGNKEKSNPLAFFTEDNTHTTVPKYLRKVWLGPYASTHNISINKSKAEDLDDYRREVVMVNPIGRAYKKEPLIKFMSEHNL